MNFHDTKMGRIFFEDQLPQLIQAIQALTAALGKSVPPVVMPVEADPNFLSDLYFGNYECGVFKQTDEPNELEQAVKFTPSICWNSCGRWIKSGSVPMWKPLRPASAAASR